MRALVVPVCYASLATVMAGHRRPKDDVASARLCLGHPRPASIVCAKCVHLDMMH
jgi:hypothetical protein